MHNPWPIVVWSWAAPRLWVPNGLGTAHTFWPFSPASISWWPTGHWTGFEQVIAFFWHTPPSPNQSWHRKCNPPRRTRQRTGRLDTDEKHQWQATSNSPPGVGGKHLLFHKSFRSIKKFFLDFPNDETRRKLGKQNRCGSTKPPNFSAPIDYSPIRK